MALFKYKEDLELYFFVHSKGRDFEPSDIEMTVKKIFGLETDDTVEWNIISEPFTMGMRTKYRPMVRASYGLSSNKLLEVKGFIFEFNGKDFVAGYISDWSNDPQTNREKFRSGQAAGDNAAGCNAVVTAFNSVSHEFKEKSQHCYLTALKAQ
ncbi:MAG: hypothetical protein KF855_18140 [Acidobacteria bacterium]|nr:hypothetical protein [Acidobacteriota bacterium]